MSVTELVSGEHRAAAKAAARAANHVAPDTTAGSHWWGRLAPLAVPAADAVALAAAVTIAGAGWPMAGYAAAVFTVLAVGGQQRLRICLRTSDQVGRIVGAASLPLLIALPWMPPGGALRAALSCAALVVAVRAVGFAVLRALHRRGRLMEHALVVGVGPLGAQVARLLGEHRELGLRPRGFVDSAESADSANRADAGSRPPGGGAPPVLGQLGDLGQVIARFGISRVILCLPAHRDEDLVPVLRACRMLRAEVCLVPRLYEVGMAVPTGCLDEIWGIPLIPLRRYGRAWVRLRAKRAFDVVASALLLAVLAPVMALMVLAVWLGSGRPALFRQVRVTGAGRRATLLKLRTLSQQADPDTQWVVPVTQCTAMDRLLRRTHLDELPQLINVLRGDMSLVGPRPERPYFAARFTREIPGYAARHRAPAGMTGWAQVHGLNGDTSIEDRARFDNSYIEHWSFWLDLVILARTFATCIPGSSRGGQQ